MSITLGKQKTYDQGFLIISRATKRMNVVRRILINMTVIFGQQPFQKKPIEMGLRLRFTINLNLAALIGFQM